MENYEKDRDRLLQIGTIGRDDVIADEYRYPYEPTPYGVLERLADSGLVGQEDVLLDYGCGKGRVGFFLSHVTGAKTIGIEYDDRIFATAMENCKTALCAGKTDFVLTRAEEYQVPGDVNRCYFFNPFSAELLHTVMARILESWYEEPREIFLFFYYPSDEYISYLMTVDELEFYDEIECDDLFDGKDPRERIMIFQLPLDKYIAEFNALVEKYRNEA
ncbi:MAG: class I SAM-dependent methyltransferase [Oscillospiraceae bacterium]|nr:class I SAM-dependent methyltransferase [Oscillospiraceae bacterium]